MGAKKSYQSWSWVFLMLFIILSVVDIRFGLLGFVCMGLPIYHALRGRGKIHCSKYCPRGSMLGKFLKYVALDNHAPYWMRTKTAKNILLGFMMVMFALSLYHAFQSPNVIKAVAFGVFRLMMASLALGVIMGILFKPRTWCQVCPMGHATGLIKNAQDKRKNQCKSAV